MRQPRHAKGAPNGGRFREQSAQGSGLHLTTEPAFPAHGSQTLPWKPASGRRPEIDTYEASIPPEIASLAITVGSSTEQLLRQAAVDVAVLERTYGRDLGGIEAFLARTEAIASSKIESELTTVDQLARAQHGIRASKTARTVYGAIQGLELLIRRAEDGIELDDILSAHRPLMENDPQERWEAGRLRSVQNWIGGSNRSPQGALYVPPPSEQVRACMEDLLAFAARTDLDPTLQAAMAHAQFESIHPFTDGNGRIGRSLINAVWRFRGVTTLMAVPVASAIVADRDVYFDHLNRYRDGEAEAFVSYLADATIRTVSAAEVSAQRLRELPVQWRELTKARAGSAAAELIEHLVEYPVVDAFEVSRLTGSSQARAYSAIDRLLESGVLRPITESKRDMAWAAGDVLDEADLLVDRLR